ncbi:hypothetical protein [Streptomyces sp. CBMA123]|uniref:hypothetical protein n=1 Tax=Streptomyces sp. CBMA123 TaxID=1896313 RepID=UPI001661C9C4|nr:hypothetical protein [Streptomyces sp. CBMA123]MBD0691768.1 hypothetical protein [Streptomyces sp. CBMA123]
MTSGPQAFPPRPVRGVRARYVFQSGCPSAVADATVDFEPWEEGVHLESARDATVYGGPVPAEELARYHGALVEGVRAELAEQLPGAVAALAIVVHRTVVHDTDTSEYAYRRAGRVAVREVLAVLDGDAPSRRPKDHGRRQRN